MVKIIIRKNEVMSEDESEQENGSASEAEVLTGRKKTFVSNLPIIQS